MKMDVLRFLTSEVFTEEEIILHLLIATGDTRQRCDAACGRMYTVSNVWFMDGVCLSGAASPYVGAPYHQTDCTASDITVLRTLLKTS